MYHLYSDWSGTGCDCGRVQIGRDVCDKPRLEAGDLRLDSPKELLLEYI